MARVFCIVVAHEVRKVFAFVFIRIPVDYHPVAQLHLGSVAGTVLLLFHALVEALFVECHALLAADELCEVEWEAEGIKQCERLVAGYLCLASLLCLVYHVLQHHYALLQSAQE